MVAATAAGRVECKRRLQFLPEPERMVPLIDCQAEKFNPPYRDGPSTLDVSWDDIFWAALTYGRPSIYHYVRHGWEEALLRIHLVRMAIERNGSTGRLHRTEAYKMMDPTEKGMVSYFLGMTVCKLFAWRHLGAPWLLHLDAFRDELDITVAQLSGRTRPDLIAKNRSGEWIAFECKGRSSNPTKREKADAKQQARNVLSVEGSNLSLSIAAITYFTSSDTLRFYWQDPEPYGEGMEGRCESNPGMDKPLIIEGPIDKQWRYYYEPAWLLASETECANIRKANMGAGISVDIHPKIREFLENGKWQEAHEWAYSNFRKLLDEGFKPDGLKLTAKSSS